MYLIFVVFFAWHFYCVSLQTFLVSLTKIRNHSQYRMTAAKVWKLLELKVLCYKSTPNVCVARCVFYTADYRQMYKTETTTLSTKDLHFSWNLIKIYLQILPYFMQARVILFDLLHCLILFMIIIIYSLQLV